MLNIFDVNSCQPTAVPGTIQQDPGSGRDVRDSAGAGDAEFWQQQWDRYEEDNAIVDVDVRGWIYTPHRGPLSRKNRIFVGLARQMVGIPAERKSPTASGLSSRATSPHGFRERIQAKQSKFEDEIAAKAAESLIHKGEAEAAAAGEGTYSEKPTNDNVNTDENHEHRGRDKDRERQGSSDSLRSRLEQFRSIDDYDDPRITPVQKRASWNTPAQMSSAQVANANKLLMSRLQPFLANPVGNMPVSAFFYNDQVSRQRTFQTNAYGQFNFRASLDFIPTHVRILAHEKLSYSKEVIITEPNGVSLISDIDDTIKHSAIASGAREIFRNVFIRELGDLHIQGVREWYQKLAEMDVKFHYVSNSPWQLFPLLTSYLHQAELPDGSIHLKAYSGMFQGIFEPVAERKKGTLSRIFHDFPDRRFILVGDSGEADLEVYTDVVLENPGRVLGVFIRDVTTTPAKGFFDSAMGPLTGDRASQLRRSRGENGVTGDAAPRLAQWNAEEDDPDLKRAIAASLEAFERESKLKEGLEHYNMNNSKREPLVRTKTEPPPEEEDLIDLKWGDEKLSIASIAEDKPEIKRTMSIQSPPQRPKKPAQLSGRPMSPPPVSSRPRPPLPRKPSSSVNVDTTKAPNGNDTPSPFSGTPRTSTPAPTESNPISKPKRPQAPQQSHSYREMAREKLSSAYQALPSPYAYLHRLESSSAQPTGKNAGNASVDATAPPQTKKKPPLPPRRTATDLGTSAPASAASSFLPSSSSLNPFSSSSTAKADNATPTHTSNISSASNLDANTAVFANASSAVPASKKEELWKRRWARAKEVMDDKGVLLRSWREGGEVLKDAIALVEKARREREAGRRGGVAGKGGGSVGG